MVEMSYDPESDILYIELKEGVESDIITINDAEILIDEQGTPIAIEIWNASKHGLKEIITNPSSTK